MKQNIFKITIACLSLFLFLACDETEVTQPDYSVKLADGQVIEQIGDTLVCIKSDNLKFKIQGNPDMLVFFSGQVGSEYKFRDRTEIDGTPSMSFQTTLTYGTQFSSLKVYLSSTFPGITRIEATDSANIANKDYWKDITAQCNLPTVKTTPNNVKITPKIDLSEYKGKPLYIAFQIAGPNGNESTWRLDNLKLANIANGVEYEIGTFKSIGFTAFDFYAETDPYLNNGNTTDKTNRRFTLTTAGSGYITGGGSNGLATIINDDWAISANINLTRTYPDLGTAIKGFDNAPLEDYEFEYKTAGVYTITFVGSNLVNNQRKEVVKELIIKIID